MGRLTNWRCLIAIQCLFLCFPSNTFARGSDSVGVQPALKRSILPAALIVSGAAISGSSFEHNITTAIRGWVGSSFEFEVENYLQYVPVAELYVADLLKVNSKNHWFTQTKYLVISNLISSGITRGLKYATQKARPNGAALSFPSGHTTLAFTNATVLFCEFEQSAPLLAYSGFAFAATTGAFRMLNNKHWVSDVLVGAGIGLLVTHWVYYFEPLKSFNPFGSTKNVVLVPTSNGYGVYFSYVF